MEISDFQNVIVRLNDMGPGGGPKRAVKICVTPAGISLHPEGVETGGGDNAPIMLYVYKGVVRLFVWADPESHQPTHAVFFGGSELPPAVTAKPPPIDDWGRR